MIWKDYSHLDGTHAFLSPSKHYWLNYDEDKLISSYQNFQRIALGTRIHKVASELIKLSIRLPDTSATLNWFVNDAIGFRMESEVTLFHSIYCYGTADAISFRDGILRIHDLKTGRSNSSLDQLLIYAALFVLNYGIDSKELKEIYLRIYQNDEVKEFTPSVMEVFDTVNKILIAEKIIKNLEGRALLS